MIWTSCYGRWRLFPEGCLRAAVSLKVPKGNAFDVRIAPFAPDQALLDGIRSGTISTAEYAKRYLSLLESREGAFIAADRLRQMDESGRSAVLLCWEADGFCHRHLLAKWLNIGWSLDVRELEKPK